MENNENKDLETYAERINRETSPSDKFAVTLTRDALTYIRAILCDRKASLEQSLTDKKIKPSKAANRALEYGMVMQALDTIEKAKLI